MRHPVLLFVLPWALWAQVETQAIPKTGPVEVLRDVMDRFATYEACDKTARWAEAQPSMREAWTLGPRGERWHSVMTYECRQQGGLQ
jgi:hypothetical protein